MYKSYIRFFFSRNGFIYYCSICNELGVENLARPTTNCPPYSSMAPSILANASSSKVSMSQGMAAGPVIPGNYQQPSTVKDSFRDFMNAEASALLQKDTMTGASLGMAAGPMILGNYQQRSTVNDSFSDFMTVANYSKNASLKKSMGSSLSGRCLEVGMSGDGGRGGGSTFEGMYNNLNVGVGSYGSAGGHGGGMEQFSDPINAPNGGITYNVNSADGMYNTLNVGGGSYGSAGGGRMEEVSDQMNTPYGGTMYNVNNVDGMLLGEVNNVNVVAEPQMSAQSENYDKLITRDFLGLLGNGMLVGEVNNNVVVEPQMNVQNENCDNKLITRDFLGLMENGMSSLSGGGMVDDHNGNGMVTNPPDNEATTSAEARPSVRG